MAGHSSPHRFSIRKSKIEIENPIFRIETCVLCSHCVFEARNRFRIDIDPKIENPVSVFRQIGLWDLTAASRLIGGGRGSLPDCLLSPWLEVHVVMGLCHWNEHLLSGISWRSLPMNFFVVIETHWAPCYFLITCSAAVCELVAFASALSPVIVLR